MSALTVERAVRSGCRARPIGRAGRTSRPTRPAVPVRLTRVTRDSDRATAEWVRQAARSPEAGGLRLSGRGRMVLLCLLAAVLVAVTVGWGAARAGAAATDTPKRGVTVIVGPGDSLWSIAGDIQPRADRQRLVDRIIAVNDLDSAWIEPGQRLTVPVRR